MDGNLQKYERVALWVVVAGLAIYVLTLSGSLGDLQKKLVAQESKLERTVLRAEVVPGIPDDLTPTWRKARSSASAEVPHDYLWLTARVENIGFDPVNEMSIDLSAVPTISRVFAYTASGKSLTASWGGPEIKKGGTGKQEVSVTFPDLPPGEQHLLFVGFRRDDLALAQVSDAAAWADKHRLYWNRLAVSTRPGGWADFAPTETVYGFASMRATGEEGRSGAETPKSSTAESKSTAEEPTSSTKEPKSSTTRSEKAPG
ncbi:MAG TPA: hypothetical protein VF274_06005 [Alphaproteobacteria bacterium]